VERAAGVDERLDPATGWRRRIYGTEVEFGVGSRNLGIPDLPGTEIVRTLVGREVDAFLPNGARCYRDVGDHPEYATPECTTLDEVVTWEAAGPVILEAARRTTVDRLRAERDDPGIDLRLYKHNVDTSGKTFGTHENYLVDRSLTTRDIAAALATFLVVRPVICGAGQVVPSWLRSAPGARGSWFAVSQRARHIDATISETTTQQRALVNTRDEAHADRNRFRRLHLICGDANMATASTLLKIGATALALRVLETDPSAWPRIDLADPIRALHVVGDDPGLRAVVELEDGRHVRALDLHVRFVEAVTRFAERHGLPGDEAAALDLWATTVDDLDHDLEAAARHVDWVAKRRLVTAFAERRGLARGDDQLVALDLAWHDVDPQRSLHHRVVARGAMDEVVGGDDVERATRQPPTSSRAAMRGEYVRRAMEAGLRHRVGWTALTLLDEASQPVRVVDTLDPFERSNAAFTDLMDGLAVPPLRRTA
jgi:proteasome accessory factor A